jgi:hypothetical protein
MVNLDWDPYCLTLNLRPVKIVLKAAVYIVRRYKGSLRVR